MVGGDDLQVVARVVGDAVVRLMDIDSHPTPTPPAEGGGSQDVEVVTAADLRAGERE